MDQMQYKKKKGKSHHEWKFLVQATPRTEKLFTEVRVTEWTPRFRVKSLVTDKLNFQLRIQVQVSKKS